MKTKDLISLIVGITFVALGPATWAAGHGGGVVVSAVAVVDTPEAVQGLAGNTSLVEEDSVLLDQDSVVVPGITIAEACVSLIRAPGSRLVDRPRLPDRLAG